MNFKIRKKHPKEADGNLKPTRHYYSGIRVDDGECGDHYCDGHTSYFVKCSCGFARQVGDRESPEEDMLDHRMAVIEYHLGLRFSENDD